MKKVSMVLLLIALMAMLLSCSDVNPGYVGLKIYKRGNNRGEIQTLGVGRYALSYRYDIKIFPTFNQNYVWTKDQNEGSPNDESLTFPIEGLNINIDVGIEFAVDPENVATIYSEYRKDLEGITDGAMRNYVRDAFLSEAQKYTNMEEFITKSQISSMVKEVEVRTNAYFKIRGIIVNKLYLVNSPRYPETVTKSIEEKIKATQVAIQRENELREAEAEAKKKVAEAEGEAQSKLARAKAEAEANKLLERSVTPIILQKMWIEKWDGKLPEYMTEKALEVIMTK